MFCFSNPSNQHPWKKFVKKFRLRALRQNKCDWISWRKQWCSSFIAGISFYQTRFLRSMKIADNMRRPIQRFWREIEVFFASLAHAEVKFRAKEPLAPWKFGDSCWKPPFLGSKLSVSGSVAIMIDSLTLLLTQTSHLLQSSTHLYFPTTLTLTF